ncbi:MAG: hypothetical protein ACE5GX_02465 [Thermoanaerobaculia bacterium]
MFGHTSRYYSLEDHVLLTGDGRQIVYRARRLIPRNTGRQLLAETVVNTEDRPDLIANRALGQPEQFWQVCDSSAIMDPHEMTARPGRRLRVFLSIPSV